MAIAPKITVEIEPKDAALLLRRYGQLREIAEGLATALRPLINPEEALRDYNWAFMDGIQLKLKAEAALARYDKAGEEEREW